MRGIFDAVKGPAFEHWRNHLVRSAAAKSISVVQTYKALNGPNGDQKLLEYMQADGLHLNEHGHRLVADLHRQLGYAFTAS